MAAKFLLFDKTKFLLSKVIMRNYKYAYLYDDVGLSETYFGRKILINTRNIHTYSIITSGVIEKPICRYMEQTLKPGNKVLDVGSNIGFLSLLSAHLVGPTGKVDAFEANPDVYNKLFENALINGFKNIITCHNNAVFNEAKTLNFTWNSHRDGSGRIVSNNQANLAEKSCEVKSVVLDEMFGDQHIDFIKVDTEGAEPFVLNGAKQVISNNPKIHVIFEWNKEHITLRDADPAATIDFVFSRFKHVKRFAGVNKLETLTPESMMALPHSNLVVHN